MVTAADAEVVGCCGVEVQLRCDAGSLQCQVHEDAVLWRTHDIVAAVHQKYRRRSWRDVQAGSELVIVLRLELA